MNQRIATLAFVLALGVGLSPARGEFISGSGGLNNLGAFTGTFTYSADSATSATLSLELTNTSPGGSGFLTAFAFNNPTGKITSASLVSSDPDFVLLGATPFSNGVNAGPFGQFDFGASTGSGFEGGGPPSKGIAVGNSATFTFTFVGAGLNELMANSFFDELSSPPGAGQGTQAFVARFRGFEPNGSDKVPGLLVPPIEFPDPSSVPEPGAIFLASSGLLVLGLVWRRNPRPVR